MPLGQYYVDKRRPGDWSTQCKSFSFFKVQRLIFDLLCSEQLPSNTAIVMIN